jgi:hypothetical protein
MPSKICFRQTNHVEMMFQKGLADFVVFWIPSVNRETTAIPKTKPYRSDLWWISVRV